MDQLINDLLADARLAYEKAWCWCQRAEENMNIAEINRIGWQSGQSWINDELDAEYDREWRRAQRAEVELATLIAALFDGGVA